MPRRRGPAGLGYNPRGRSAAHQSYCEYLLECLGKRQPSSSSTLLWYTHACRCTAYCCGGRTTCSVSTTRSWPQVRRKVPVSTTEAAAAWDTVLPPVLYVTTQLSAPPGQCNCHASAAQRAQRNNRIHQTCKRLVVPRPEPSRSRGRGRAKPKRAMD